MKGKLPDYLIIQLDKLNKGVTSCLPGTQHERCICLETIRKNGDFSVKTKGITGVALTREQYPIMLCYALTIHKSQGKTLNKTFIDIIGSRKPRKSCALTFVAFSRVTDISKCKVKPFNFSKFEMDSGSANLWERKHEETRLEEMEPPNLQEYTANFKTKYEFEFEKTVPEDQTVIISDVVFSDPEN